MDDNIGSWRFVESMPDFPLPKKISNSVGVEDYTGKSGMVYSDGMDRTYMVPSRKCDVTSNLEAGVVSEGEFWLGISTEDGLMLHCKDHEPSRKRIVEEDPDNPIYEIYVPYTDGSAKRHIFPYFLVDNSIFNNEGAKLMQPQQIIDCCDLWITALNSYPEKEPDMFSLGRNADLSADDAILHFKYDQIKMMQMLEPGKHDGCALVHGKL